MTIESSDSRTIFERFENDQLDLDVLCSSHTSESRELWGGNSDYGAAEVLRRYSGVSERTSICAVMPHGIYLDADAISPTERDSGLPAVLVFPPYRTAAYQRDTDMVTIPFTSPFVYANRLVDYDGPREGTLFFLAHSSPVVHVKTDWQALADELTAWPEHMSPISVMVYWQDYLLGHHKPFEDRGFRIVSAGHSGDPEFLVRQAYLLRKHEYAASNGVGSHMFYSIHAGCPFHVVQIEYEYAIGDQKAFAAMMEIAPKIAWPPARVGDQLVDSFSAPVEAVTPEQQSMADYYLGMSHAMSPSEMARFLRWLVHLDRFGRLMLLSSTARRVGADGTAVRSWVPTATRRFTIGRRVLRTLVSRPVRLVRGFISNFRK